MAQCWMRWKHPAGGFVPDQDEPMFMRPRRLNDPAENAYVFCLKDSSLIGMERVGLRRLNSALTSTAIFQPIGHHSACSEWTAASLACRNQKAERLWIHYRLSAYRRGRNEPYVPAAF